LASWGLALYSGCVAPAPDPASADTIDPAPNGDETVAANVVLRVDVENGHSVTFYEPAPGGLYLAERMASGQKFVLGNNEASDALTAFARLRPQVEVPATLQAAYDRARNLPRDPVPQGVHASGGGQPAIAQALAATSGVIQQALTSSSSAANFVDNDGGCDWGPQWSFCRVNWGGGFWAWTTATSGLCTVDLFGGDGVTIQLTTGNSFTTTFQAPGTSVQYGMGSPGFWATRRIDILNAANDSFHVGCRWGV